MKKEITFTAKQVGERVKERRTELNLTMPELGKRVGVNKSTIQRYEADGVDPKRTMIINGLAEALLTTPEWLTGLSEDKEYDSRTLCAMNNLKRQLKSLQGVMFLFDEVTAESASSLTKLEMLRKIHDETGIPIVICGVPCSIKRFMIVHDLTIIAP